MKTIVVAIKSSLCVMLAASLLLACDMKQLSKFGEKNENYDSLFLGFSFGMEKKAFFDHCWEMNKQEMFVHGDGNLSVEYRIKDELASEVQMKFYPNFHEEKIFEMPVTFSYAAWAPWNKQYWSDVLLEDMLVVFKKWYGEDFKILDHPVQGKVYYKIDGKRRINLFIRDDQFVQAVFTDLKVEKKLKEDYAKTLEVQ